MEICIQPDSSQPQFEQLMQQIKAAVSEEILKPGDPLPSIRQLAKELELNNKTVAKAYKLLERDAVIQTRGYRGSYVHENAHENSKRDLQEWTFKVMHSVVSELRRSNMTDSEIRNAFSAAMNKRLSN